MAAVTVTVDLNVKLDLSFLVARRSFLDSTGEQGREGVGVAGRYFIYPY